MTRQDPSATGRRALRVAYIEAGWHADIVRRAHAGFIAEFEARDVPAEGVERHVVPGVFEIPLLAQRLAATGRYDAVVACGFVVDGGIYRHEFVSDAVIAGLMRVQLDTGVPVLSVVLTPQRFHEHEEHRRFFTEHFVVKGREAAAACLATIAKLRALAPAEAA